MNSYIPYEGRVDIHIKQDCKLLFRIPEWATPKQVGCTVNKEPWSLSWAERYAKVGEVENGDMIIMKFPIEERTVKMVIS